MRILITNDDGWGTPGIRMLAGEMSQLGEVTVIAPDSPRSGHAACITVGKPLYLSEQDCDIQGVRVYTTNGTPADCVKLGLEVVMADARPDLLVSGINHGNNCSINIMYSGTMGACFVGAEHGVPAIGFSIDSHAMDVDLSHMRPYLLQLTEHLLSEGFRPRMCYNINAPVGEIAGVRWTRQCRGHWTKEMLPKADAEGRTCYELGGEFVNEEPEAEDTDIRALADGYLSVQPVTIDMTDYAAL